MAGYDQGIAHVAREGVMNQRLSALLSCLRRNHDTAARLIYLQHNISLRINYARILAGSTRNKDHVRSCLTNLVNGGRCSGNCLAPYDRLHIRVGSHSHRVGDNRLCLSGKVIRISSGYDHVAVKLFHLVCLGDLLVTLGSGSGNDTDLKVTGSLCALGLRLRSVLSRSFLVASGSSRLSSLCGGRLRAAASRHRQKHRRRKCQAYNSFFHSRSPFDFFSQISRFPPS